VKILVVAWIIIEHVLALTLHSWSCG